MGEKDGIPSKTIKQDFPYLLARAQVRFQDALPLALVMVMIFLLDCLVAENFGLFCS